MEFALVITFVLRLRARDSQLHCPVFACGLARTRLLEFLALCSRLSRPGLPLFLLGNYFPVVSYGHAFKLALVVQALVRESEYGVGFLRLAHALLVRLVEDADMSSWF